MPGVGQVIKLLRGSRASRLPESFAWLWLASYARHTTSRLVTSNIHIFMNSTQNKAPVSLTTDFPSSQQVWTEGSCYKGCIFYKVSQRRDHHPIQIPLTSSLPLGYGFLGDPALPALPHLPHNEFRRKGEGGGGEGKGDGKRGCSDL